MDIDGHRHGVSKQPAGRNGDDDTHHLEHPTRQPGRQPYRALLEQPTTA
jgi:hypothetical protein